MSALGRAAHGSAADEAAELYARHCGLVLGICRALLRHPEDAADAAQQAYLSAHRALLAGTRPEDPAAWLATIARNECRMKIRKQMAAPAWTALDEDLDGHGDATYQGAVRSASVGELRDAIAELPARQREALLLREVRGLSYDEVARAMAVSAPTVETLIFRARKQVAARVRVLPGLAFAWAKDALTRLGGPADVATAGAVAAKGVAAVIAAVTATSAAVEVKDRAAANEPRPPAIVQRVDNSGPGSASSGRGSGEVEVERVGDGDHSGRGRGRGWSGGDDSD